MTVQFNAARYRNFPGRVFQQSSDIDLALVAVDVPGTDAVRRVLRPPLYRTGRLDPAATISNIGHSGETGWEANLGVNKLEGAR